MRSLKLNTIIATGITACSLLYFSPCVKAAGFDYTQKTNTVHYNWGYGSPANNVPKDNFRGLFDQSGTYSAGDYFIQTLASDGVRVITDGNYKINRWASTSGTVDRSLWLNVSEGAHSVKTEYYEGGGQAALYSDIVPFDHWLAYYYPNNNLQGIPTAAKVIAPSGKLKRLTQNLGLSSPVSGIPKDNFSAKYSTAKRLPAGQYIFRSRSDDGIRVYLDGKLVLDHWKPSDAKTEDAVKLDINDRVNAAPGEKDVHWIDVDYYDGSGGSQLDFFVEPYHTYENTWVGEIYPNLNFNGSPIILGGTNSAKQFSSLNFDWGSHSPHPLIPNDRYTARFTKSDFFHKGYYTFQTYSDDGFRIFVDDKLVLNSWGPGSAVLKEGKVLLSEGIHKVKVEYYENTGLAKLKLNYFQTPNSVLNVKTNTVHYNWGYGNPANISKDYFSATFDQSRDYQAGDYFLQTIADDGVKVEIDNNSKINRWTPSNGSINQALWLNVNQGPHTVKTHYYEGTGQAFVYSDIVPLDHWLAYYYPNNNLQGNPTAAKIISPVGSLKKLTENIGINSPASGIPKDNFSAKYTTAKRLTAGQYILRSRSDDGMRIYVDGKLVIDKWKANDGKTEEAIKLEVKDRENVPASEKEIHWIQVDYYDATGASLVDFFIEPYNTSYDENGWLAEIYPNLDFTGNPIILGGKNSAKPIPELRFDWGNGTPQQSIPADMFAAKFKKQLDIPVPGKYLFKLKADDGVRLLVDGVPIIDSWINSSGNIRYGLVNLTSGLHQIEVQYYENSGTAYAELNYEQVDNNLFLNASPQVHYNWGTGSPSEDIPVDNFKMLFDQSANFSAGNYFIQTLADDGIKVNVDGQTLIDRMSASDGQTDRALWLNASTGYHNIETNYYEDAGKASIFSNIVPFNSWVAYYYNNTSLDGPPIDSKVIPSVNGQFSENNATGSPIPGKVNSDQFSAKYSTSSRINAGDYIIRTNADDGVKVYVDGELVLNRWTKGSVDEDAVLVNIKNRSNVPAGQENIHWIDIEYYENTGDSSISFALEPFSSDYYTDQWVGFIYPNKSLTGNAVVIGGKNSTTKINDLNFDWKDQSPSPMIPSDEFSARFKKKAYYKAGNYVLNAFFDDGAKIWVDGKLVVDAWYGAEANGTAKSASFSLTEGYHEIIVEYFENVSNARFNLTLDQDTGFRVAARPAPYGPDFYQVKSGTLYHYLGEPGSVTATIYVGPSPAFLKEGNVYVKDPADKFYLRTATSDNYVGTFIPPYKSLDLRFASYVTAGTIDSYIKSVVPDSPLIGYGQSFINAQNKYGVNALYMAAHSLVESNWGRSRLATESIIFLDLGHMIVHHLIQLTISHPLANLLIMSHGM
ncbi:PA14 domain-containing protein [Neobacillus cucumis]|uniref:PA14 domain-containing protein n=1 Tax=Neobacillus cucumis TaxID=1740721 RepID=UPI002041BC5D|nr:PA14 domain-containing protein [Neobacillus cucumis]MCM3727695.1 PA14 domain-containing protein [Neobacillus cucumis]